MELPAKSACAWSPVPMDVPAAWKSGMAAAGEPCAMTGGTSEMQQWPVGSWDAGERWPPPGVPDSDLVQDRCGWTMWGVEEESRPSGTVPEAPGAGATATTRRMQGWSALVLHRGCALLMVPTAALAAWRFGTADAGGRCVTMLGTFVMPPLPAGSWAAGAPWPPQGAPSLGRGLDPSSWTISGVGGMRQPCDSALPGPGASMTVTIGRMLVPCVMACLSAMCNPRPPQRAAIPQYPEFCLPQRVRPQAQQAGGRLLFLLLPLQSPGPKPGLPSCAWWLDPAGALAAWRYGMTAAGGRFVMTAGT